MIAFGLVAFGSLLHAQAVFRVTAIPDESPTELARKAAPLMKYLEFFISKVLMASLDTLVMSALGTLLAVLLGLTLALPASKAHGRVK